MRKDDLHASAHMKPSHLTCISTSSGRLWRVEVGRDISTGAVFVSNLNCLGTMEGTWCVVASLNLPNGGLSSICSLGADSAVSSRLGWKA